MVTFMIVRGPNTKQMPLNIVGSSTFGRYAKISKEKTYNMLISDGFLVNYPGYKLVLASLGVIGRGLFDSAILDQMIAVVDNNVYVINAIFNESNDPPYNFSAELIGTVENNSHDVTIAENNSNQIAICDGSAIYIYNKTANPPFQKANTGFIPTSVAFHDTYFIATEQNTAKWHLSANGNGLDWSGNMWAQIQTKPDIAQAVVRFPSRGNMILVFGQHVVEPWLDFGYQLFPYGRSTSFSIDYGCLNPSTIAATDEIVVWLAANEESGPVIMYTTGSDFKKITTDGIDYLFSNLTAPQDSEAFIFRQDGHLIYHINFYTDNISLFYDFNTSKFFHATDENQNYYLAKDIGFFNNQYYFISKKNGNLYAMDTLYTDYDGAIIPRIRITQNIRLPDQSYFIVNDVGFTVETGMTDYHQQKPNTITDNLSPTIDLSISIDGGESFSSFLSYPLNSIGKRRNKVMWWQLGIANDFVCQFRFWSTGRVVATDGVVSIRQ